MPRVLIIDDEPAVRDSLSYAFGREGYEVVTGGNAHDGLQLVSSASVDIVVLDLMLPDRDGGEICREIRRWSQVPVVMLTARDQPSDRLLGFELGADDYVTKPFNTKELIARVNAVLRRAQNAKVVLSADEALLDRMTALIAKTNVVPSSAANASLTYEGLTLVSGRTAATIGGRTIELSAPEYRLARALCAERGRVVTRTELVRQIWGEASEENRTLLEMVVRTLREKLEGDPGCPLRVVTVPGIGYQLVK